MHTIIRTIPSLSVTAQLSSACASRRVRSFTRTAALTLVAAAAAVGLQAQSNAPSAPHLDLNAAVNAPLDLSAATTPNSSSSSSDSVASGSIATERLSLSGIDATQPPPRRSYGSPRYSDSSHNADGSNKYTFEAGAGFTLPVGGTHNSLTPSYDFQFGGGRNFSNKFAVLAQFDWDNFGIQTSTLNNLLSTYANLCSDVCTGALISQIGGTSHVSSFSLNPMYTFMQSEKTGAYVVAGAGFYHKTANFTTPAAQCDQFGCYSANATIDKYTSNAPGVNGGVGFTYRPSRFAGERFFAEARYVFVANQSRPYYDGTTGTQLSPTYFNLFPQNSARTTYIPVIIGIRF